MTEFLRGYCEAQLRILQRRLRDRAAGRPRQNDTEIVVMSSTESTDPKNELMKSTSSHELDGFEGYTDHAEGADRPQGTGIIQGVLLRFTNEAKWTTRDGDELSPNLELVAVDVIRLVQRWQDQRPIETRVLAAGEKFPDLKALNESVPKDEWIEGPDGQPRGPWQNQHLLYLLDPATMSKFSYVTGTIGGAICVRDLVERVQWMRKFRGPNTYAVITLSTSFMPTKYGGRQRPSLLIKRWVSLDGAEPLPSMPSPSLPPSSNPPASSGSASSSNPSAATTSAAPPWIGAHEVRPPSLKEEMGGDDLPDFLK
jgi:hypothetical protein